jgi:hypothetical protein
LTYADHEMALVSKMRSNPYVCFQEGLVAFYKTGMGAKLPLHQPGSVRQRASIRIASDNLSLSEAVGTPNMRTRRCFRATMVIDGSNCRRLRARSPWPRRRSS